MKFIFLIALLVFSVNSYSAKLDMKTGLWQVKMMMEVDGKKFDPMEQIKKTMAMLPKAQQEAMLAKMNVDKDANICFTKEMLENPDNVKFSKDDKCKHKIVKKTSKRMEMKLDCKDGVKGDAVMTLTSPTSYEMKSVSKDKEGRVVVINQTAKFLKADCK